MHEYRYAHDYAASLRPGRAAGSLPRRGSGVILPLLMACYQFDSITLDMPMSNLKDSRRRAGVLDRGSHEIP